MRACEKQVGDTGDDQCCGLWGDSRVRSREKVEGGVGGEAEERGVVEVGEECVAVVALWAGLSRGGLDIEHRVLFSVVISTVSSTTANK